MTEAQQLFSPRLAALQHDLTSGNEIHIHPESLPGIANYLLPHTK